MVRLLAYFQRQQRRNFTNQNVEIYKLVYQYSHTHPIPNTPNSSLTNTRNREEEIEKTLHPNTPNSSLTNTGNREEGNTRNREEGIEKTLHPNTPKSSLTNTRNREELASYAKLENSNNNMHKQISLFHSLFSSL